MLRVQSAPVFLALVSHIFNGRFCVGSRSIGFAWVAIQTRGTRAGDLFCS